MGATILVIEDNPTNLELMMYLLRALGHEPMSAQDGSDGLAVARAALPDLIICDLQLPRVDGYAVAKEMRRDPQLMAIPLIAVTAFAMPGDRERALAAGFDGYISKPISPERFLGQIGSFLAPGRDQSHDDDDSSSDDRNHQRATILVVEDHAPAARRIERALARRGLRLLFATSASRAAEICVADDVDLILPGSPELANALLALAPACRDTLTMAAPLDQNELISLVESSLAERMRVT